MQIFFQALSSSVPNLIEIGGGSRKFSKKLVDLTRNDPYRALDFAVMGHFVAGDSHDVQPNGCEVTMLNYVRRRHGTRDDT